MFYGLYSLQFSLYIQQVLHNGIFFLHFRQQYLQLKKQILLPQLSQRLITIYISIFFYLIFP